MTSTIANIPGPLTHVLDEADVIEISVNADQTVWVERFGADPVPWGTMDAGCRHRLSKTGISFPAGFPPSLQCRFKPELFAFILPFTAQLRVSIDSEKQVDIPLQRFELRRSQDFGRPYPCRINAAKHQTAFETNTVTDQREPVAGQFKRRMVQPWTRVGSLLRTFRIVEGTAICRGWLDRRGIGKDFVFGAADFKGEGGKTVFPDFGLARCGDFGDDVCNETGHSGSFRSVVVVNHSMEGGGPVTQVAGPPQPARDFICGGDSSRVLHRQCERRSKRAHDHTWCRKAGWIVMTACGAFRHGDGPGRISSRHPRPHKARNPDNRYRPTFGCADRKGA